MQSLRRVAKALATAIAASVLILAVVWPWPAPDVDWRTPVDAALAKRDCDTAERILGAAISAGSTDAMRMRGKVAAQTSCYRDFPAVITSDDDRRARFQDEIRAAGATTLQHYYRLDDEDLGFWRTRYVAAVLFFCGVPYNAQRAVDNAGLSKAALQEPTFVLTMHQDRRELCAGILAHVISELMDSGGLAAQQVAFAMLTNRPSNEDIPSGVLLAKLVLVEGFVPPTTDVLTIEMQRSHAWWALEVAAEAANEEAMRMMIALLHQGRFHPHDDAQAYVWVLRLRRLGIAEGALGTEIERGLSDIDRERAKQNEEIEWQVSQHLRLAS